MKRYQSREIAGSKVLLSLTMHADKPHVALIVRSKNAFIFFLHDAEDCDKFSYFCLSNELFARISSNALTNALINFSKLEVEKFYARRAGK